jgi:hypothetical protein
MVVIEHPPACDCVAQLHRARGDGVPLDVVLLTVDASQLSGLEPVLLAYEHFDLGGKPEEAAVEVARDPVPATLADAVRRLCCVVRLMLAEQHDLGARCPSAQCRWLVRLAKGAPVVGVAVLPALWLKPPAAIGMALETDQRALVLAPRAVFDPVGVARARGDLRSDAEVTGGGLLAAGRGQLVDVAPQLVGGHAGAAVCDRQFAHPAARGVEPLPVEVPHHPADSAVSERGDRVEPVDGQLAQALKVGALAAEALQQERRVRDRQLMPAVGRLLGVGCVVVLRKLAGHLVW